MAWSCLSHALTVSQGSSALTRPAATFFNPQGGRLRSPAANYGRGMLSPPARLSFFRRTGTIFYYNLSQNCLVFYCFL